jgi:hypothetical protein
MSPKLVNWVGMQQCCREWKMVEFPENSTDALICLVHIAAASVDKACVRVEVVGLAEMQMATLSTLWTGCVWL